MAAGLWDTIRRGLSALTGKAEPKRGPDPARTSFVLQQQEAELQHLRKILGDTRGSLKRAEDERQKWGDSLNEREIRLEQERARAKASGAAMRELDSELKKLRRDKLHQQRAYEDRVQDLLEKLGDLSKIPAGSSLSNLPGPDAMKTLAMEKQALKDDLRESQEKTMLVEARLEKERTERVEGEKRLAAYQAKVTEAQEKLRAAEAALWEEKGRGASIEKERAILLKKIEELQNPAVLEMDTTSSGDIVVLQSRAQEMESAIGRSAEKDAALAARAAAAAKNLGELQKAVEEERARRAQETTALSAALESEKARARTEEGLRRAAEERAASLEAAADRRSAEHEAAAAGWRGERENLERARELESGLRAQEMRRVEVAEARVEEILQELEKARKFYAQERIAWQQERDRLEQENQRLAAGPAAVSAELRRQAAGQGPESPAVWTKTVPPVVYATQEDVERMLTEIDELLAENASLKDEIQFLKHQ